MIVRALMALSLLLALFAPAIAQPAGDPVSVVKTIYGSSDPLTAKVYSKRLQALLDKDVKAAKGEAGNLDFDFAANGQDTQPGYKKTLRYEPRSQAGDRASVKATFKNFEPQRLDYDLVRENGRWAVDEVRSLGKTKWVLSSVLRGGGR